MSRKAKLNLDQLTTHVVHVVTTFDITPIEKKVKTTEGRGEFELTWLSSFDLDFLTSVPIVWNCNIT